MRFVRELKGPMTNAQIEAVYALAEQCKVGICLWQNTPSPSVAASRWGIYGSLLGLRRFMRGVNKIL